MLRRLLIQPLACLLHPDLSGGMGEGAWCLGQGRRKYLHRTCTFEPCRSLFSLSLLPLPQTKSKVKEEANGVDLDDLTAAMDTEEGSSSLAQAAAAYAQMRSTVTKTDTEASENGMTETEIAMATVLAAFLTVHPLGASLDEVVQYFQVFNPNANGIYLESLLRRLPQVFQLSQSTTGESKWWFLGFQTCCTQSQLGSMATEDGAESAKASSS